MAERCARCDRTYLRLDAEREDGTPIGIALTQHFGRIGVSECAACGLPLPERVTGDRSTPPQGAETV